MTKYTAEIGGSSWSKGPVLEFDSITDARKWAEEFGTTADWCRITDSKGREIASHRRDTSGDGMKWFEASV